MAVYFVHDLTTGLVKIGHSERPWDRLSQIQTHSPCEVQLRAIMDGGQDVERGLHVRFAPQRVRGEWFLHQGALADFIATLPQAVRPAGKSLSFWNMPAAEAALAVGISVAQLSRIRSGKSRPTPETAIAIQRVTGVSAIKLVFGDLADEAA